MVRTGAFVVAGLVAFAGCKKKEQSNNTPPAGSGSAVEHGKAGGQGSGGGDKSATGSKDSKPGSGKPGADPALVERGKYLTNLGGCALCHTPMKEGFQPDMSKMFGGGFKMVEKMPGGGEMTWVGANITSHDTGIGKWTDEQVIAAFREGVRPDGTKLLPIMPYALYNVLSDDDAKAIVAFLRSLPPVDNTVEKVDNKLPPEMFPPVDKAKGAPMPTDDIGKGAYYASIMHCVMCHTPMSEKGPDMSKAFAGGFKMEVPPEFGTGVLYTPNITPDPDTGIGKWTEQNIVDAFRKATRPDGRPILGPMMFYMPMWNQMTDADAMAVAKFLKSLPPVKNKVPASTFKPAGPPPDGAGGPPPPPPKK